MWQTITTVINPILRLFTIMDKVSLEAEKSVDDWVEARDGERSARKDIAVASAAAAVAAAKKRVIKPADLV